MRLVCPGVAVVKMTQGPKGWDDWEGLDRSEDWDSAPRSTAWWQTYLQDSPDDPTYLVSPVNQPTSGRDLREAADDAARKCSEANMAALITIGIVVAVAGFAFHAYVKLCFAISREDRQKWSLRREAPNRSAQHARDFIGLSGSKWN